jgi:predicted nuclease of predicted toxin-antitoxin system
MPKYLIDVNLPYYFSVWKGPDFIHQKDIDDEWDDTEIWKYAAENNLTIVTKDSDFSNRILLKNPPPRIIHIRIGNMKMNAFFAAIAPIWKEIATMSESHKLVNVYIDRIEGIN